MFTSCTWDHISKSELFVWPQLIYSFHSVILLTMFKALTTVLWHCRWRVGHSTKTASSNWGVTPATAATCTTVRGETHQSCGCVRVFVCVLSLTQAIIVSHWISIRSKRIASNSDGISEIEARCACKKSTSLFLLWRNQSCVLKLDIYSLVFKNLKNVW